MSYATPILFIVFNRPDTTRRVFERIREIKPLYLFVAADGPRQNHDTDRKRCAEVRDLVLNGIDWHCQVKTLLRSENLGCGRGPASAITWFFDQVEEGIILEDDCLPDLSFFSFCQEMLEKYKNEPRVMHISGTNFQDGKRRAIESYYFSRYPHSWGWASWRRAWKNFSYDITDGDDEILANISRRVKSKAESNYWFRTFNSVFRKQVTDVWDFQWCYSFWKAGGISILSSTTLIKNIGLGVDATHTREIEHHYGKNRIEPVIEIVHPIRITENQAADRYTFEKYFRQRTSFKNRLRNIAYKYIRQEDYMAAKNYYYRFMGILSKGNH